jgi:hypothetical protein
VYILGGDTGERVKHYNFYQRGVTKGQKQELGKEARARML